MRRMHLRLPRLQKAASVVFEMDAMPAAANEGKKKEFSLRRLRGGRGTKQEDFPMTEKVFVVKNETGLHARPASLFVQKAAKFKSVIKLKRDGKEANAKSIISVLSLGASKGSEVTVCADGVDEVEAVDALVELLDNLEE